MAESLPRRLFPCSECPWRRSTPPGQFPAAQYEVLLETSSQTFGAPMFGCHKGAPGADADLACAGWLAVAGYENLTVRLAILSGRLDPAALQPGDGWPELFASYSEMAAAQGRPTDG